MSKNQNLKKEKCKHNKISNVKNEKYTFCENCGGLIINTYNNLEQMSNNDILKHYVDSIKQCVNINGEKIM